MVASITIILDLAISLIKIYLPVSCNGSTLRGVRNSAITTSPDRCNWSPSECDQGREPLMLAHDVGNEASNAALPVQVLPDPNRRIFASGPPDIINRKKEKTISFCRDQPLSVRTTKGCTGAREQHMKNAPAPFPSDPPRPCV
jgi:hypothetical protein